MRDRIVPLERKHDRSTFQCGNSVLDRYFQQQVSQELKSKVCTCFVLVDAKETIKGYYTLSGASVSRDLVPQDLLKKLPRYKDLPVTLLGRLAISKNFQGQRLGELLLIDALKKSYEISLTAIGSIAMIVDPIDESARRFYLKYGFIELVDSGKMFLPMKTIGDLFEG